MSKSEVTILFTIAESVCTILNINAQFPGSLAQCQEAPRNIRTLGGLSAKPI